MKMYRRCIVSILRFSQIAVFVIIPTLCMALTVCLAAPAPSGRGPAQAEPAGGADTRLKIVRVTPAGEDVPAARRIVFEFDRPVAPIGRMERDASEIPVDIQPALACEWRWLNPSTLSCNLGEKTRMNPATRYRIVVRPGIKAEDGSAMGEEVSRTFVTERAKVATQWFKTWQSPGKPQIGIRFNQPVQQQSVAKHVFFQTQKGVRVPAVVVTDPDFEPNGDLVREAQWLVSPRDALPQDAAVELKIEPGVASAVGPEPGIEQRTISGFQTFPKFAFLGVGCRDKNNKAVQIRPEDPLAAQPRCDPSREIFMIFSSPAIKEEIQQGMRISPDLAEGRADYDPWENVYVESGLSEPRKKGQTYRVPFPSEPIKAYAQYRLAADAGSIRDEFGRRLATPVSMAFSTDHWPPDFEIYKQMPILEKGMETEAPLFVTNIDRIQIEYEALTTSGKSGTLSSTLEIPRREDASQVVPLGVRKLLGKASGVLAGRLTPTPPVHGKEASDKWFFAQVTPFHVHVKLGHFTSLVWVTDLQTGRPVPGVRVEILKDSLKDFGGKPGILAGSETGEDGAVELPGTVDLDPALSLTSAYKRGEPGLFVRCRKGDDLAVAPLRGDFQVSAEGANREYIPGWFHPKYGHLKTWGATAQGVYKVGDTVQFKIYVRDWDNKRYVLPPLSGYRLKVTDPTGKAIHERADTSLSEFGAFDGEFAIPKTAAVGWYQFSLTADFTKEQLEPMRVLVSDFTTSPFHVSVDLNGRLFGIDDAVKVSTQAKLHAGGPYTGASTRVSASIGVRPFTSPEPKAAGFQFDVLGSSENETPESQTVFQSEGKLDHKGAWESNFTIPENPILYGLLTVESSVKDDRGKSVASRASAVYVGRDRYVGLQQGDWVMEERKPARCAVVVVDRDGRLASGTNIAARVERQKTTASRVKDAGDAYVTQYVHEWVNEGEFKLVSEADPVTFQFTPAHAGRWRIVAEIEDTTGRVHQTTLERWVSGKGPVVWETIPGNVINVMPEKMEHKVGETARFFVQNPFPGGKALITVERFGMLGKWVKTLANSAEVIEIPVLEDYVPGFYVSVVVTSPRVNKPLGPGGEDLGKPAFGMGYVKAPVPDPYKRISVSAKSNKESYKPGDTVTVELNARPGHPKSGEPAPPIEIAVAVLDESVFDLLRDGRTAFDPYEGFYDLEDLDVENYNLLMHLVGREKLEKKGANPGGGGGPDLSLRSVFKFVSYWNPSIRVDEGGKATIDFKAPDNLTGWRVLAMAVTPNDLMGLGEATFKVNRSTEIRPVLPNQVMEGDSFDAGFSVMNRTEETRTLAVVIRAEGPVQSAGSADAANEGQPLTVTRNVTAEPFKRTTVRMPLKALAPGEIRFTVQAGDEKDRDGLKQTLPVLKLKSPLTAASFGMTSSGDVKQPVVFPKDMRADSGELRIAVSPTVIGSVRGAFEYMRDYPFTCWEQKITRAAMAALYQRLKEYVDKGFAWSDSAEEPARILALAADYQAPNGGMVYYVPRDEYASPYLSAYTAMVFGWLKEMGAPVPRDVEERLHQYLLTFLHKKEGTDFQSAGMASTVRAAALAALAENGKLTREDLDRYWSHLSEMSLFGKAMYLQALGRVPDTRRQQEEVLRQILALSDESAGAFRFSERLDSSYQLLHVSAIRDNSAVLSAMLAFRRGDPKESVLRDIPFRLTRFITESRRGKAHWICTQDNLFAVKALSDFSRMYESTPPNVLVRAKLDADPLGEKRLTALTDPPGIFNYATRPADPGRRADVKLQREGAGQIYYSVSLSYTPADLKREPVNAGIEIQREYSVNRDGTWTLLQSPMETKSGETVRVDLYVSLPAERYYVVVEDPVPGGLEPVNKDLATSASADAGQGGSDYPENSLLRGFGDWQAYGRSRMSFYHTEVRHNVVRFYSERLAAGRHHLVYTAQAVAPGEFTVLPVSAEEMYNADVFGKGAPAVLRVLASE